MPATKRVTSALRVDEREPVSRGRTLRGRKSSLGTLSKERCMATPVNPREAESMIIGRTWKDAAFKKEFLANPVYSRDYPPAKYLEN